MTSTSRLRPRLSAPGTLAVLFAGETLLLDPARALYWEAQSALVVADVHLGKAMHFRSRGVPVPNGPGVENLRRLEGLVAAYRPERILFVGDLFHSTVNSEWSLFRAWRSRHAGLGVTLVIGNHDVLPAELYADAGVECRSDRFALGALSFAHEPPREDAPDVISGHFHPAVALRGAGGQRATLPCFWISARGLVLPSFGEFTGSHVISPSVDDSVYVTTGREVIKV